jgi:hypothetical protein
MSIFPGSIQNLGIIYNEKIYTKTKYERSKMCIKNVAKMCIENVQKK